MNNEAIARQAIDQKWQALKSQGLDLGSRKGTLKSVGYGGYCQEYQHGRIYWHKDEGAHEVHGGILDEYLRLGGPGVHPETGRCELGFPKGDEQKWTFGYDRFPVSFFQKGVIYWVRGAGAVSIYGDFHDYYNNVSIQKNYPITGHIAIASGEAIYFDNRCFYKGLETDDEIIEIHLPGGFFSGIGHPLIMHPTIPISVNFDVRYLKGTWDNIRKKLPTLIQQLWQNRLFLQRVGFPTEMVALNLENENRFNVRDLLAGGEYVTMSASDRKSGSSYTIQFMRKQWLDRDLTHIGKIPDDLPPYPPPPDPRPVREWNSVPMCIAFGTALRDRTLYDISFQLSHNKKKIICYHSGYAKQSWENFGFIHATDLHVNWRSEGFRRKLKNLPQTEAGEVPADEFVNLNDGSRDLIRYANHLHDIGKLDFILATGDLVDYQTEKEGSFSKVVNTHLLSQIVLGHVPYPAEEDSKHEELRVPIFATLGNHDYRNNPYELYFAVDFGNIFKNFEKAHNLYADLVVIKIKQKTSSHRYTDHNLLYNEALYIQGDKKIPFRTLDEMFDMIYAPSNFVSTFGNPSFCISLGNHQIVMIDTGKDAGLSDDMKLDGFLAYIGCASDEDKYNLLVAHSPNSQGISTFDLDLVRTALKDAGTQGLVIVGMHAPPFNPTGNEYHHCFRETEHPTADTKEIVNYLHRRGAPLNAAKEWQLRIVGPIEDPIFPYRNPSAFQLKKTPYFKDGGINHLLDYGIASRIEGETDKFLQYCVGQGGVSRPIDLVLCGHTHKRVDYRLEWDKVGKKLRYFIDFYTENPPSYYASKIANEDKPVHIMVKKGAPLNGPIGHRTDHRDGVFWRNWNYLQVPPYKNPLNPTKDTKAAWWLKHRPLILLTDATGPISPNQRKDASLNETKPGPTFRGFRVVLVKSNVIDKIYYVTNSELHRNDFKLPFETPGPEFTDDTQQKWLEPVLNIMMD